MNIRTRSLGKLAATGIASGMLLVGTLAQAATSIGTNITADGALAVNGVASSTFAGAVGIGTTNPVSQLNLEGWTVNSDGGTITGGNPQFQINGTLDTTQGATGHVTGAQWYWDTVGANSVNVNGLRLQLNAGYTGTGLIRALDVRNFVQGTRQLGVADEWGNIGATLSSQSGATDNSTIGDNIGVYAIANGSKNVNIAVYGRSFNQGASQYTRANIGVVGVGGHWISQYPGTSQIGGFFAAGADDDWYAKLATTSTALLLDNEAENVPILIGRANGVDAFTVTNIGGITSTSTSNATNFWQVFNSSGAPILDLDTLNSRLGIGTSTPATPLHVSAGANATTTATLGELGLSSSKGCVNMNRSDGGAGSFYLNAAGVIVSEPNYCR